MRSFRLFPISNHATKHKEPIPKLSLLQRDRHRTRLGNDLLLHYAGAYRGLRELNDPDDATGT